MAKKHRTGRPKVAEPKKTITSFRGSDAFRAWFEEFARAERETGASLIEKALVCYARHRKFADQPPER